jgi:DNA modification methylase
MLVHATASRLPFRDGSIHFGITSSPYYSLRSYEGLIPQVWGGDPFCVHEWGDWQESHDVREESKHGKSRTTDRFYGDESRRFNGNHEKHTSGAFCRKCGAWYGHLGNEPNPSMFVANLVTVGQEVMRVLHPQGVWILNLGDSFANDTKWGGKSGNKNYTSHEGQYQGQRVKRDTGFKPKDKMLIPARVAIALQESGWYVRQDMVWPKQNGMPESVKSRPTVAHEYLFLLSKSERYYWDNEGVKQPATCDRMRGPALHPDTVSTNGNSGLSHRPLEPTRQLRTTDIWLAGLDAMIAQQQAYLDHLLQIRNEGGLLVDPDGNPLAVRVASKPWSGSHYAVFPPGLITDLIRGGTSERGVCPECGKAWERVVENGDLIQQHWAPGTQEKVHVAQGGHGATSVMNTGYTHEKKTIGWQPTCKCNAGEPVAPIVLDCFTGSGTTGEVCQNLTLQGHPLRFVGVDLSAEYLSKHASVRAENRTTQAALEEAEKRARARYEKERGTSKKIKKLVESGQTELF